MPLLGRRRPLMRAAMVGGAGYAAGKHRQRKQEAEASAEEAPAEQAPAEEAPAAPVSSEADRIEALTKLKGLLDSGVLTQEQYDSERQKLLQGL